MRNIILKNIILATVALLVIAGFIYFATKPNIAKAPVEMTNDSQNQTASTSLAMIEAKAIAEKNCIKKGETLGSEGYFNQNSQTWWFDAKLKNTPTGCNPACVVHTTDKTVEINWRCTGFRP